MRLTTIENRPQEPDAEMCRAAVRTRVLQAVLPDLDAQVMASVHPAESKALDALLMALKLSRPDWRRPQMPTATQYTAAHDEIEVADVR